MNNEEILSLISDPKNWDPIHLGPKYCKNYNNFKDICQFKYDLSFKLTENKEGNLKALNKLFKEAQEIKSSLTKFGISTANIKILQNSSMPANTAEDLALFIEGKHDTKATTVSLFIYANYDQVKNIINVPAPVSFKDLQNQTGLNLDLKKLPVTYIENLSTGRSSSINPDLLNFYLN